MPHYVHHLVAHFVCLLFGAGQVLCSNIDIDESSASEPNNKATGRKIKTMS